MLSFNETIPLALYLHLPWCIKKCPYCDFNSHAQNDISLLEQTYIELLIRDLEMELPDIWGRRPRSVFIGGGTPSLFSAKALGLLLSALSARLNIHRGMEITLEANPGTAEAGKFCEYYQHGINRLSIGVQSFDDAKLKALGRIHNAREAGKAIELAKQAGFENFNIDIMFGLPGQDVTDALRDLQTAIDYSPTHISWYQLTIEPNTVFYSRPPALPDDELSWQIQQQGQVLLAEHGYEQYEVSAYAKKGFRCIHNLNYWQFGDYLGLGAGAHGKITDVKQGTIRRTAKVRVPESYMEKAGSQASYAEQRILTREDICFEFMLNALRLSDGFASELFLRHTGMPLNVIKAELKQAEEKGLILWQLEKIKPTEHGKQYLNDLMQLFL